MTPSPSEISQNWRRPREPVFESCHDSEARSQKAERVKEYTFLGLMEMMVAIVVIANKKWVAEDVALQTGRLPQSLFHANLTWLVPKLQRKREAKGH